MVGMVGMVGMVEVGGCCFPSTVLGWLSVLSCAPCPRTSHSPCVSTTQPVLFLRPRNAGAPAGRAHKDSIQACVFEGVLLSKVRLPPEQRFPWRHLFRCDEGPPVYACCCGLMMLNVPELVARHCGCRVAFSCSAMAAFSFGCLQLSVDHRGVDMHLRVPKRYQARISRGLRFGSLLCLCLGDKTFRKPVWATVQDRLVRGKCRLLRTFL
jgi:hypothetical protein